MKVSIVIPCYNVAPFVVECLNSAFGQTYPDLEVIAVDNLSTDDTLQVLQRYQREKEPNLIILEESKPGAPAARNRGLRRATGNWIQFLDADDLLLPAKIEHQISRLAASAQEASFVVAASIKQKVNGLEHTNKIPEKTSVWLTLFLGKLGNTCANLWRKDALQTVGGWNEVQRSSQEPELMFRLLKRNEQVLIDQEPFTIIRERKRGQISDKQLPGKIRFMELRLAILSYLQQEKLQIYQQYYHQFYGKLYEVCLMIAAFDISKGAAYFKMLPADLKLPNTLRGKGYQQLIKLFGFERIERIRRMISSMKKPANSE